MPEIDSTRSVSAPQVSRRAVVGTVAWGAPAIVVASAAPALAASVRAEMIATGSAASFPASDPAITFSCTVENNGNQAGQGVVATITVQIVTGNRNFSNTPPNQVAGWTRQSYVRSNGNKTAVATYSYGGAFPIGGAVTLNPTFVTSGGSNTNLSGTASVTLAVDAPGVVLPSNPLSATF